MKIELTVQEYLEADEGYLGYCRACHAERDMCEPDARGYKCDECGAMDVYGASELLQMGEIEIMD
jgi:hypothetical protein